MSHVNGRSNFTGSIGGVPREIDRAYFNARLRASSARYCRATDESRTLVRIEGKVGRNDPCPCGSGKKFKRCHFDSPIAGRFK